MNPMRRTLPSWILLAVLAGSLVLPSATLAGPSPDKCRKTVHKESERLAAALNKSLATCFDRIARLADQGSGDLSGATPACIAQFRRIGRSDGKSPADRMEAKIRKACDLGGSASIDLADDGCGGFVADEAGIDAWLSCRKAGVECSERRAIAASDVRVPRWLDLLEESIASSDHRYAAVALDALRAVNDAIEGGIDDDVAEIDCAGPSDPSDSDRVPTTLELVAQPVDARAGIAFDLALLVLDQDGQPMDVAPDTVSLELDRVGLYQGEAAVSAAQPTVADGVVVFDALSIRKADSGYSLTARLGDLAVTSQQFAVTANPVQHVMLVENGEPLDALSTVTDAVTGRLRPNGDGVIVLALVDDYGNVASGSDTLWGYQIVARPARMAGDKSDPGKLEGFPTNVPGAVFGQDYVFGLQTPHLRTLYFITQKPGDYTVRISSGDATPWDVNIHASASSGPAS